MNVKIPEAPINWSKAAVSTRQEAASAMPTSARGGSASPRTARTSVSADPVQSSLSADLAATSDMLLDITTQQESKGGSGYEGVNEDCGREREMCSSPRLHNAVKHRLQQVQAANQRFEFVTNIVTSGIAQKARTITPAIYAPSSSSDAGSTIGTGGRMESGFVKEPSEDSHHHQSSKQRPATGAPRPTAPPGQASSGAKKPQRPSSCFVSKKARFTQQAALGPPVGHYNARFAMVDRSPRTMSLSKNEYLSPSKRDTHRHVDKARNSLDNVANPGQGNVAEKNVSESEKTPSEGAEGRVANKEQGAPGQGNKHPTSAFASRVPQLKGLQTATSYYQRDEDPRAQTHGAVLGYNEAIIKSSPRGIVAMSKSNLKRDVAESSGTMVVVDLVTTATLAARKNKGRPSTSSPRTDTAVAKSCVNGNHGGVDFGRQVSRAHHTVHGQRYSAFSSAEETIQGHRATGLRDNDPGRDGTSIDYAAVVHKRPAKSKGSIDFSRQVARKPLYNPALVEQHHHGSHGALAAYEYDLENVENRDPKKAEAHKRVLDFATMHKPPQHLRKSECTVEVYDPVPEDVGAPVIGRRVSGYCMAKGASHDDPKSVFSETTLSRGLAGTKIIRKSGYDVNDNLIHPNVMRNIDLSKVDPHQGPQPSTTSRPAPPAHTESVSTQDAVLVRERTRGNPFLSKHLSRHERNKVLQARTIATSDRDYNPDRHITISGRAHGKMKQTSRMSFDKVVARDKKSGGRMGPEYDERGNPGPCDYSPRHNLVCSPSRAGESKSSGSIWDTK